MNKNYNLKELRNLPSGRTKAVATWTATRATATITRQAIVCSMVSGEDGIGRLLDKDPVDIGVLVLHGLWGGAGIMFGITWYEI